ncbi:MAG: SHOCT domain-containing protein [Pseudonocardiaceae bacterium]
MITSNALAWILADPGWRDAGWGDGAGPWLFGPVLVALWLGIIALVVWLVVRNVRPRERTGLDRAREVLAERYARGELSTEEYQERFGALRRRPR